MPSDYLGELYKLASVEHPYEAPNKEDWQVLEAVLGISLDSGYRSLVSALGTGRFGCGLYLRNPVSTSEYVRLSRESLIKHREHVGDLEEKLNFPLYPAAGGNACVASIDRQFFYLRNTSPGGTLDMVSWLDLDLDHVRLLKYKLPQLLHDLYLNLISEAWAEELRAYIWLSGSEPFFTPQSDKA